MALHLRYFSRCASSAVLGALSLIAVGAMGRAQAQPASEVREPDLEAAVIAAQRALEQCVFARAREDRRRLVVMARTTGAHVDPVRSVHATESLLAALRRKGSDAAIETEGGTLGANELRVTLSVTRSESCFALKLGDEAPTVLLGSDGIEIAFTEQAWVRGALPRLAQFEHVVRAEALGSDAGSARVAAEEAVRTELEEAWPALRAWAADDFRARMPAWVLDSFETHVPSTGVVRCALLVGLTPKQVQEVRLQLVQQSRARLYSWSMRGAAGCLWLGLCVMLCIRADLATRGYLSWIWRAGFGLVFALGVAGVALWT